MCIFAVLTKPIEMRFTTLISKVLLTCTIVASLALAACQPKPKTNLERIDALKKQVQTEAKALNELETKDFVRLQKDFIACDSMLQYLHPETVDEVFQQLQLVGAYIEQFKVVNPLMKTEIDSTLTQLDNLKADALSNYLTDSLVTVYLADEAQHVDKLSNQIQYFKDRFSTCQKNLDDLKK